MREAGRLEKGAAAGPLRARDGTFSCGKRFAPCRPMTTDDELERLRATLRHDEPRRGALPAGSAAVLAPLVQTPYGLHVLLERRPPGRSPFAGQLSFPGGRVEPTDATPLAAALREAHEEVGFRPDQVDLLGHLADMDNHLGRRVIAYVGLVALDAVPGRPSSPTEVEELLLVPLHALRFPGAPVEAVAHPALPRAYRVAGYESRLFSGRDGEMHYWRLEPVAIGSPVVLWGLTAEMIARLLTKVFGWAPPRPARRVHRREDVLP